MKRMVSIFVLAALMATLAIGGQRGTVKPKQLVRIDRGDQAVQVQSSQTTPMSLKKTSTLSWVLVDSVQNSFGMALWNINEEWYDGGTKSAAIIHRGQTGYAAGSGQLWYNLSTDSGATWHRVSELNAGVAGNNSRYPSAAIWNPTNSADPANAAFIYANPELTGGSFGAVRYGLDSPLGGGAPASFEVEPPPTFSSELWLWPSASSSYAFWTGPADSGFYLYRTNDYTTFLSGYPSTWLFTTDNFATIYNYTNGDSRGGTQYLGALAQFAGDTLAVADSTFIYDFNFGYSKSTDDGATWSGWTRPQTGTSKDWHGLPGFGPSYYVAGDYFYDPISNTATGGLPNAKMVVDANNKVHFFTVVVDTTTRIYSVVEIYEGPSGWTSNVIKSPLNPHTKQIYYGAVGGDLDQDGWDLTTAVSPDGKVISVFWLDAATSAATDTISDIWFASCGISGGTSHWSPSLDISNSPGTNDLLLHVAPILKANTATNFTAFLNRSYEGGNTTLLPESINSTDIYSAMYTFDQLVDVRDNSSVPSSFALKQNYPNPFNPTTTINYSLAKAGVVSLRIYNVLGQQVTTLVNGYQTAGTHSVEFKAANLASGVYLYSLKAGNNTEVKKMVLMK